MEVKVSNKKDLELAVKGKIETIIIEGEFAEKFIKTVNRKRTVKKIGKITAIAGGVGVAAAVVAAIAFPPSAAVAAEVGGGAAATALGAIATQSLVVTATAAGTTVTMTAAETLGVSAILASLLGWSTFLLKDIFKYYDVNIAVNGVEVNLTRKQG